MPRARFRSPAPAIAAATALALAGCSVNEFGFVEAEKVRRGGGVAYSLSAVGLHLDTRAPSPSLTLGSFEAFYLFPESCDGIGQVNALETDELFLSVTPQAVLHKVSGLQLSAGAEDTGVMIGYRERFLAANVPNDASFSRKLVMDVLNPADSRLEFKGDC